MGQLDGRVAIVTGSTQGLGEGIAIRLAQAGAAVVVNGRSAERGARVLARIKENGATAIFLQADVSIKDAAQKLVHDAAAQLGSVDILINNAIAMTPNARVEDDVMTANFDTNLRSGLYASLWTAQAAFAYMKAKRWGRIINFGSLNGVAGTRYDAPYNVAKEGLLSLTRTMAHEWGEYGITVNAVLPSGLSQSYIEFNNNDPKRLEASAKAIPMRRLGRPVEDIGAAVLGLVSDHAGYITGQSLFIDGGQSLGGVPQLHTLGAS